jgi:beta-N-acetylhexosaminidase
MSAAGGSGGARGAAELVIVGVPGKELEPETEALLRELRPGGVILFRRNVESAEQLGALVAAIRRAAPGTLLYCDAEGGRVDRLAGIVGPAPAGAALGRAAPELARRAGRWVGESLRLFGFDVDFAPVVDLDHGEADNALDGRYLGRSPAEVVPRARAFLEGLHEAGVGGCVKHFPGLGPSRGDTHFETGLVEQEAEALGPDLEPFARLADLAGSVMVAHAVFPGLDPERRPASLSRPIASLLLRGRLGFTGVAVADDLEMQALDPWGDLAERSAAALAAGCDLLPICHTLEAVPGIVERLAGPDLVDRVTEARARLHAYHRSLEARQRPEPPDLNTVRARLAEVAEEAERRA